MKIRCVRLVLLSACLVFSTVSFGADDKGTPKADPKPDVKGVRLIKPYSDLKDLTAEQTTKLKEIHKKYSDQIKALEAAQKDEMSTVLTDAQKKELADVDTKVKKTTKGKMKDEPATPVTPATPAK